MNAYRVHLADGTDYVTSMNATLEEAVRYFVNKELNVGQGGEDRMVRVLKVEPAPKLTSIEKRQLSATSVHDLNYTAEDEQHPAPCVNSDAQQEMTHADDAPEFEPCPICKETEPNFDGYCQQCEVALERKTP